jgi:host factor-I protein
MDEQNQALQNEFLNTLRKERVFVSVFLVNGIRLAGHIQSFDQYSIRLQGTTPQLVLKRVVATVVPERGGRPPRASSEGGERIERPRRFAPEGAERPKRRGPPTRA